MTSNQTVQMPAVPEHSAPIVRKEKEFWLLGLASALYFFPVLFLGRTFFHRDLYLLFFPQKRLWAETIRSAAVPLWDPFLHGGQPYIADIGNFAFYPGNILFLILPVVRAFNVFIVAHFALGCMGAYALARHIGFSRAGSVLAGLIYGWCGYNLSTINILIRLVGGAYLPWIVLAWHLYFSENDKRWFFSFVCLGVLQVLSGAVELHAFTVGIALAWSFGQRLTMTKIRLFTRLMFAEILIIGLAAIQIIPTAEMYLQSSRETASSAVTWSLNPRRLPEFVIPNFLGRTDQLSNESYWGARIEDQAYPYILSIYFGMPALLLVIAGAIAKHSILTARARLLLSLLFLFGMLASFGRFLPLFQELKNVVPLLGFSRFPVKFFSFALVPAALLAGNAFDGLPAKKTWSRIFAIIALMSALACGAIATLMLFSPAFSQAFQKYFFHQSAAAVSRELSWGLFCSAALSLSFAVCTALLTRKRVRSTFVLWLILAITSVDLLWAGRSVNPTASDAFLTSTTPAAREVHNWIGDGRLYRIPDRNPPVVQAPQNEIMWLYRYNQETLNFYTAAAYSIPVVFHHDYDRLANSRLMTVKNLVEQLPWPAKVPLLSAAGVRVIASSESLAPAAGIVMIGQIENIGKDFLFLYRNANALGPVHFFTGGIFVKTQDQALKAIRAPSFDPRRFVVIEGGTESPSCADATFEATVLTANANRRVYRLSTQCSGYLLFTEVFYPGWKIKINGVSQAIYKANYAYCAIFIGAGENIIEHVFRPISHLLGAIISFLTLLGCLLIYRSTSTPGSPRL